uniref:Uncharacterized protein n=1 Tax=Rousettus aegyptiacus TaxID=9407 RepID=A0A7J8H0P9_ROUAE|nr:hypothetical protein HJG63_011277 [Rousettus aegyptiacus]
MNTVLLQSRLRFAQKLIYHILMDLGSTILKELPSAQRNQTSIAFPSKHFCLVTKCNRKSMWSRIAEKPCGFLEPQGIKKVSRGRKEGGQISAELTTVCLWAVVTKYHKPHGLKQQKFTLFQFWRLET